MKPQPHIQDLEFKKSAVAALPQKGNLVVSFENEPPNVVALYDLFPESLHVFVDTVCSDSLAVPKNGLYRLTGYEVGTG